MRAAEMRLLEMHGQQRLPLPGVEPPDACEYLDALKVKHKRKKKT